MQNQIAQAKQELKQLIDIVNKNRQATNDAECMLYSFDLILYISIQFTSQQCSAIKNKTQKNSSWTFSKSLCSSMVK
jgi:hypothetical protein